MEGDTKLSSHRYSLECVCVCVFVFVFVCVASHLGLVELHQNRLVCMSTIIKHQVAQQGKRLRAAVAHRHVAFFTGGLVHRDNTREFKTTKIIT